MPKYGKQAAGFYLSKTHKKYQILSEWFAIKILILVLYGAFQLLTNLSKARVKNMQ